MDWDDFVEGHESLLMDICRITKRPIYSVISTALRQHCKHATEADADAFGKKVATVVSYARTKKFSVSSGKKTAPATLRLMQLLTGDGPVSPALPVKTPVKADNKVPLCILDSDDSQGPQKKRRSLADVFKAFGISKAPSTPGSPVQDIIDVVSIATSPAKSIAMSPVVHKAKKTTSAKKAAPGVQASSSNAKATYFTDTSRFVMVRMFGGQEETAPLEEGPSGFCIAHFNGQVQESEMPNILLQKKNSCPVIKKPAAGKPVLKRPASSLAEEEEEEEEEEENQPTGDAEAEAETAVEVETEVAEPEIAKPEAEVKGSTMALIAPVIVRVCNPTHASSGKSYIQGFHVEDGREKKICLANVTGAHCQAVINELHEKLSCMEGFTKADAQNMKDQLVKKYATQGQ